MFAQKMPWVATTPQSRLRQVEIREAEGHPSTAVASVAPPPTTQPPPPPPAPKLSPQEEEYRQQQLTSLKKLRGTLPQEMEAELSALNSQIGDGTGQEVLTHRHLNQHHRLEKAVANLKSKIQSLDKDWQKFVEVANQFNLHKEQYTKLRAEQIQLLQDKLVELQQVRQEISKASQGLTAGPSDCWEEMNTPQFSSEAAEALTATQMFPDLEMPIVDDGYLDTVMEEQADPPEQGSKAQRPVVRPFGRVMASPTKVHQSMLKQAAKDQKDLSGKEKAKKDAKDGEDATL